jgi:hypothetical protein
VPVAGWKQLSPVYFYSALVVCLLAITPRANFSWPYILLLTGFGIFSWTLIEYALHRFIFHYSARSAFGRRFVYAAHLSHHEHPRAPNRLFSGLVISLPIATAYLLLAWLATGSSRTAAYLFTGLVAGYSCYEWLHFQAHHLRPPTSLPLSTTVSPSPPLPVSRPSLRRHVPVVRPAFRNVSSGTETQTS